MLYCNVKNATIIPQIKNYTTSAIESLNSTYKKLNRQRVVFPINKALLKSLYFRPFRLQENGLSLLETGARHMENLA